MRLWVASLVLLLLATTGAGLIMQDLAAARAGDSAARLVVFAAALIGSVSFVLLARIVLRIDAARRAGKE